MKNPAHDDEAKAGHEQGELFERHLTASFPSKDSQAGIALADLLKGEHLRQVNWLHIGWRLAAAIKELKYLDWPVTKVSVHIEGRKRPIADYSLPQWVLTALTGTKGAA